MKFLKIIRTLPSSGIVRAVRSREYPVKTPISIVFLAFTNCKSIDIIWPASGAVPINALKDIPEKFLSLGFKNHIFVGLRTLQLQTNDLNQYSKTWSIFQILGERLKTLVVKLSLFY